MTELIDSLSFQGVAIGLTTFLVIGLFHPVVIKFEYYFGTKHWWVFLVSGIACIVAALFCKELFWSALLAITGFSLLWSIIEIFDQKQRVEKGWFPMNPKRKHCYKRQLNQEHQET